MFNFSRDSRKRNRPDDVSHGHDAVGALVNGQSAGAEHHSKAGPSFKIPIYWQKRCLHKFKAGCELTTATLCCACADTRPFASEYLVYVDGRGNVLDGTRWQHYCPSCKVHWSEQQGAFGRMDLPVAWTPTKVLKLKAIDEHAEHHINIIISDDVTIGALREDMAEHLCCKPSELLLQYGAEDPGNDTTVSGLEELRRGAKEIKITCVRRIDQDGDFDMMEDVQGLGDETKPLDGDGRKRRRLC
ncbi:hypothetical protein EJ04DRAFT_555729 [Polyplosphaeria fusca]|uniref:Uncharacterized protein n=1 Tax=Polyplosphaeria fusca TaxID=682080 RepID=A0A9P4QRE1_9PLEO|nr:hypothetical protein EJ04DRAFT_555729 [Polyplosphaeria fusca]